MNTYNHSFRHLIVWKESRELTLLIYRITKQFPDNERYGMTSQLRRASSSVVANIAEGNERSSKKDALRFFEIAKGSLIEVDCFIDLASKLQYLSNEDKIDCINQINKTAYLLMRFKNSQIKNQQRT
jgi:four helix bundle protein